MASLLSFEDHVARLPEYLDQLLACAAVAPLGLDTSASGPGIYLLSEGTTHLYIGRTRSLRARLNQHCSPNSGVNKAAFAVLLAREETGLRANYRRGEGRDQLLSNPNFAAAFLAAKHRIAAMSARFVEIEDPIDQTLFEVYASLRLNTRYNNFATH